MNIVEEEDEVSLLKLCLARRNTAVGQYIAYQSSCPSDFLKHHPRSVMYRAVTRHITPLPAQTSRPPEAVASSVSPARLPFMHLSHFLQHL